MRAKAVEGSAEALASVFKAALALEWLREDAYTRDGRLSRKLRRAARRRVRERQKRELGALKLYQQGFMARACGYPERWPEDLDEANYLVDKPAIWLTGYQAADNEIKEAGARGQRSNWDRPP